MNPFKHKQLDEFTITDCEEYIAQYPYGEHISDVKKRLKEIKSGVKDILELTNKIDDKEKRVESQARKVTNKPIMEKAQQATTSTSIKSSSKTNESNSEIKSVILWIIGGVVAAIIGIILFKIAKALFPGLSFPVFRGILLGIYSIAGYCLKKILDLF